MCQIVGVTWEFPNGYWLYLEISVFFRKNSTALLNMATLLSSLFDNIINKEH